MQISGIGGGNNLRPVMMPKQNNNNPEVDSLQKQIEEKRKQLSELSNNDKLSPEQKQKKRESLQQEITELEAQKNQAEMAAKQKERQEAEEKMARQNDESLSRNEDGDTAKISARGMKALISAGQAMDMADVKNGVRTSLKCEAGILESEIKLDQARGDDTTKKEEQLSKINTKANDLNRQMLDDLDQANDVLAIHRDEDRDDSDELDEAQKNLDGWQSTIQTDELK